jgi:hypothetical protein
MKKKANKEQIDKLKSSLYYKIFDTLNKNGKTLFLDKELNLIWDEKQEVVGIIVNNKNVFFEDDDKIIDCVNKEWPFKT